MKEFERIHESEAEIPRIRVGRKQTIETLVNEEALLLSEYLRKERETWTPRITVSQDVK